MRGVGRSWYSKLTRKDIENPLGHMEAVWNYCGDPEPLLPALVQGFKKMGFSVTAEGIETEEMGRIMVGIGCDNLQGFYYSPPLPMAEFLLKYDGQA